MVDILTKVTRNSMYLASVPSMLATALRPTSSIKCHYLIKYSTFEIQTEMLIWWTQRN